MAQGLRGVSEAVAVSLLVLAAVAAAVLLYAWAVAVAGPTGPQQRQPLHCMVKIDSVEELGGALIAYARLPGCRGVSRGYLVLPGGASYPLGAGWPRNLTPPPGGAAPVVLYGGNASIPPGRYLLRLVALSGVEATYGPVRVGSEFSTTGVAVWANITGLNGTYRVQGGVVSLTVESLGGGNYRLWFSVTPDPGYTCTHLTAVILNHELAAPRYIGKYYIYDGDCVAQYWQPLIEAEQPYLVVVAPTLRRS